MKRQIIGLGIILFALVLMLLSPQANGRWWVRVWLFTLIAAALAADAWSMLP